MKHSAIRISDTYAVDEAYRATLANATQVYGDAQPIPDELGGFFEFADWQDRPVTAANFLGRWTFLYFGYARCKGTCQTAAPLIANAAREVRAMGIASKACFVDIEAPPVTVMRMQLPYEITGKHQHSHGWEKRKLMAELAVRHRGDLEVLGGSRAQLSKATAAFHVLREHTSPRPGERDSSINHSSVIYLIGPDTLVAGYGYHDMAVSDMVGLVTRLSQAERRPVDLAAVRQRYVRGACGGDLS